ncbi:MAG: hypothetical protein RIS70_2142, partial [Planctomycetota bacterium]
LAGQASRERQGIELTRVDPDGLVGYGK